MKFVTSQTKIEKIKTDALVVLTSKTLNKSIKHIDKNLNGVITKMIQDGDFSGKNISTCVVRNASKNIKRLILVLSFLCFLAWQFQYIYLLLQ